VTVQPSWAHLSRPAKAKAWFLCFALIRSSEYILNLIKELSGNQRLMSAFVLDSLANEISQVKTVLEDRFAIRASETKPERFRSRPQFLFQPYFPHFV
jgi:hypothetical protein